MIGSSPSNSVVYVSNAESREIFVFRCALASNSIDLIQRVEMAGIEGPSPFSAPLVVSPDSRFLYAVLRKLPYPVSTYSISPDDDRLNFLDTASLPDSMCYLSIDRTGRFILSASYFGAKIAVSQIGVDEGVQSMAHQIVPTGPKAHCIMVDGANRYAYGTSLDDDAILQFRFDENAGLLTPIAPAIVKLSAGSGPRHLAFGPDGRFLYVITEYSATIAVLSVDARSGTLSLQQTLNLLSSGTFAEAAGAADIHLTSDGRFLFGSDRISHTITSVRANTVFGRLSKNESVAVEGSQGASRSILTAGAS